AFAQSPAGDFYGTTAGDGFASGGTIFRMDAAGVVATVYSFRVTSTDGAPPGISLAQTSDGSLVATTSTDGSSDTGAVFLRAPSGIVTTVCTFSSGSADAAFPAAPLVEAADGSFVGTTTGGGLFNRGAIFRVTREGALAVLHAFAGGSNDGAYPQAALVRATDGNFYGTTFSGGQFGAGAVFQLSATGAVTLVHHFSGAEGAHPTGAL